MSCPFYGKHASVEVGAIVEQHGNQCAIIVNSYSPCLMEQLGYPVDARACELLTIVGDLRPVLWRRGPAL